MKRFVNYRTYFEMLTASLAGFWFLTELPIEEVLYMTFCTATAAFAVLVFASDIIKNIKRRRYQREIYRRWKRKKERMARLEQEWPMYEQDVRTGEIGRRIC